MIQGKHSFTRIYYGLRNKLLTNCYVSAAWSPDIDRSAPPMSKFEALWDTGASASVISEHVANELDLQPEGTAEAFHAQGSAYAPIYFVNFGLPNNVAFQMPSTHQIDFVKLLEETKSEGN